MSSRSVSLLLCCVALAAVSVDAFASENSYYENELLSDEFIQWGAGKYPYNSVSGILDPISLEEVGRFVPDRFHDKKNTFVVFRPFGSSFTPPFPGETVFVTLWVNNDLSCYVDLIVQHVPLSNNFDINSIIPTTLSIAASGNRLNFREMREKVITRVAEFDYSVPIGNNSTKEYSGKWYMSVSSFAVNADAAEFLRNTTPKELGAGITYRSGNEDFFKIGSGTAQLWEDVFSFNPSCESPYE